MRDRPENFAGRWAAKEAVSKVLGLGVRGVGWREIEIVRLPTGQPSVRLNGRALRRAEQLGMGRMAVSISHERDYAVAIAFGIRQAGGAYVFPPDIEARLDERERRLMARIATLRRAAARTTTVATGRTCWSWTTRPSRRGCRSGPRGRTRAPSARCSSSPARSTTSAPACSPPALPRAAGPAS